MHIYMIVVILLLASLLVFLASPWQKMIFVQHLEESKAVSIYSVVQY